MKKGSTLIFLVSQFNREFNRSSKTVLSGFDLNPTEQESFKLHEPPERSLRKILDYAKSFDVAETETIGKVEWILN
jgi:hypothetical protein